MSGDIFFFGSVCHLLSRDMSCLFSVYYIDTLWIEMN